MKKYGIALCAAMTLFFMTGCGNAASDIKKASEEMKKLDNYTMNMDIQVKNDLKGSINETTIKTALKVDNKNEAADMSMDMIVPGMSINVHSYIDMKGNVVYVQNPENGAWTKEAGDKSDNTSGNEIFDILAKASEVEKVKSDNKDVKEYKVTLSKEDATTLFGSVEDVNLTNFTFNVTLDKENKLKSITIEQSNEDATTGKTTVKLTYSFDKYNNTDSVTIPSSVIEEANKAK